MPSIVNTHAYRTAAARFVMDSVTVVLPTSAFAALYALAKVGGPSALLSARDTYPSWQPLKDPLLDSVTELGVKRCVSFGREEG